MLFFRTIRLRKKMYTLYQLTLSQIARYYSENKRVMNLAHGATKEVRFIKKLIMLMACTHYCYFITGRVPQW